MVARSDIAQRAPTSTQWSTWSQSEPLPMWVRMGIHWGSPRRRGDDIVGRDVNLAARIVDLAGPGEVLCSEALAEQVGTLEGVEYEPLGPVFVRGVAEPVPLMRAALVP